LAEGGLGYRIVLHVGDRCGYRDEYRVGLRGERLKRQVSRFEKKYNLSRVAEALAAVGCREKAAGMLLDVDKWTSFAILLG